jgi:hypothetical protein
MEGVAPGVPSGSQVPIRQGLVDVGRLFRSSTRSSMLPSPSQALSWQSAGVFFV